MVLRHSAWDITWAFDKQLISRNLYLGKGSEKASTTLILDALSMAGDNTNGPKRISSGRVMRFKKRSLRPAINLSNCKYEVGKDAHPALQRSSDRRRSLYISILRQGEILVAICHRLNHKMMPLLLIRALVYHRPGRLVTILDLCMKLSWSGSSKSIFKFSRSTPHVVA